MKASKPLTVKSVRRAALSSLLFLAVGAPALVKAEDDLLSLMGGGDAQTALDLGADEATAKKPETHPLRKLLPKATAEQNIFIDFFEKGDFARAFYQWPSAFEGSSGFANEPSGQALYAYLAFKNDTPVFALEQLLAISAPEKIDAAIVAWWKNVAPGSHQAWAHVSPNLWQNQWEKVFGPSVAVKVLARQSFAKSDLDRLKDLIKKSPKESVERAWLEWQYVLLEGAEGDAAVAAKVLSNLMKAPKGPVKPDLMTVTAARLLYQNGFLDASIKYYEKVDKSSDDWFDAQEEMAWAMVRKGEPQDAMAVTKTLMNPAFAGLVGPEAVFVRSIALLKVCDYQEVAKTLEIFRDRFKERARTLLALSESGGDSPAVRTFVERAKSKTPRMKDLNETALKLPRYVTRDALLLRAVQSEKALEDEAKRFADLYGASVSQGTAQVGFQGRLEHLRASFEKRVHSARAATLMRVKELAADELNEISATLQKMHIVEAEVLQQTALVDRIASATSGLNRIEKKGSTGSKSREKDKLVWPSESETWFDELANYRVDLSKGCQSITK